MMGDHMIYSKLKYVFLLLIMFILDPELFIIGLLLFFLRLQSFIWGFQLSCLLTIMDIRNFLKSKTTPAKSLCSFSPCKHKFKASSNFCSCVSLLIILVLKLFQTEELGLSLKQKSLDLSE